MNIINGEPHFYNVPGSWLPDLGRLAVLSGRIETSAYRIATGILGLPGTSTGRTRAISDQAKKIRRCLDDPTTPHWFDVLIPGWSSRLRKWTEDAPVVTDATRNLYLHASYVHQYLGDDQWEPVVENRLDALASVSVSAGDIANAVLQLMPVEVEGMELWADGRQAIQWAREQLAQAAVAD